MDMNFEKNASVKFDDYTKNFLQSDSDPATMEVVTRTNAVKSPTNSPETTKLVYTVKEVAQMPVSYTHLLVQCSDRQPQRFQKICESDLQKYTPSSHCRWCEDQGQVQKML